MQFLHLLQMRRTTELLLVLLVYQKLDLSFQLNGQRVFLTDYRTVRRFLLLRQEDRVRLWDLRTDLSVSLVQLQRQLCVFVVELLNFCDKLLLFSQPPFSLSQGLLAEFALQKLELSLLLVNFFAAA